MANNCYTDGFGNVYCNNSWSTGARIGTAVGIAVVAIIFGLIVSMILRRRRQRLWQRNVQSYPVPPSGQIYPPYPTTNQPPVSNYEYNGHQPGGFNHGPSMVPPNENQYQVPPVPPPTYVPNKV